MKPFAILALAFAAATVHAQVQDGGAERARIQAERAAVQARFAEAEKACRARFAVTDCVNKATRERNTVLSDLKRQERVINDADRKRKAAERQRDIDARSSPEQQQHAAEKRARAVAEQKEREAQAAEKAAKRATDEAKREQRGPQVPKAAHGESGPQGTPRAPHANTNHGPSAEEAAKNRADYEARQKEAEKHKAEVIARKAKRTKPVADLPLPAVR
jgi:hypothetical protein